ncbi:hypothetical protein M2405_003994 [Rhodococcus erythropolis]|nr:hypothetical protein [Rhodococcus erythropolis]MCS4255691.1 hypothetical protein [Rhodococcus erythropolis]MCW2425204.1 hypothetical protein [Rhodococcus erythropolis]
MNNSKASSLGQVRPPSPLADRAQTGFARNCSAMPLAERFEVSTPVR